MKSQTLRLIVSLAACVATLREAPAADSTLRQDLASELIRAAVSPVSTSLLTTASLEAALLLAREAVALDPDNAEIWHTALDLALLAENEELKRLAIERLVKLDPYDEQVRLMRVNAALEKHQTVEERAAACEKLLTDANVSQLGAAVSSALALDLALLHQRQGDINRFSQWLSKAIAWDSSNRAAAAIAAGFFRMNLTDPVAEAELLVNLMLADPTDVTTQAALAQLLLEHGAFTAAERIYRLATRSTMADQRATTNGLLADYATAAWGKGDPAAALEILHNRQVLVDSVYRHYIQRSRPELTPAEVAKFPVPIDPTLATVAAAIYLTHRPEEAASWIERAIRAYDAAIESTKAEIDRSKESPDQVAGHSQIMAGLLLEQAWVGLWLGADAARMESSIAQAQAIQPLSAEAKNRFDGWLALRRGELDAAVGLLRPIAETDISARIGLALALEQQGNRRDAARALLMAARAQPGSLNGIWAWKKLETMLGQSIPASDQALALDRLVASISRQFDRCVDDPSLAIGLRILPAKLTYAAHEPILFDIEISNHASIPLALDRNGPIRPQLLVVPSVRSADAGNLADLRPIVLNIGRRLRLAPHQKFVIPVNLRHHSPADVLNMLVVSGAIVRLKTTLNFNVNADGIASPGLYGLEVEAPVLRVDGRRISDDWIRETIELMKQVGAEAPSATLSHLVILAHVVAPRAAASMPAEMRQLGESARVGLAEAFARLNADAQAWMLSAIPRGIGPPVEGVQPVLAIARKSQDRMVQMVYLLFHSVGSTDPMLDAALRGDDLVLRRLAELVKTAAEEAEKAESAPPRP